MKIVVLNLSTVFLLVITTFTRVHSCTVFIVGKDATVDGSVLVSHSNDGEFETDPRLVKIPAQDWPEGSKRPVFFSPESYPRYVGSDRGPIPEYWPTENQTSFEPIGYIDQVPHTFAYMEDTYGAINEHQVGIGESTCSGVFGSKPLGVPNGTALFSVDALTQIAMERARTAREAILLMGKLAEEQGFYGAGEFEGTAESLGVTGEFYGGNNISKK
jgi:dipeptidase